MRPILLLIAVFSLAGCQSWEGVYQPGCVSYAGDTVVLKRGRFEWHKFTDEVVLDSSGNRIDPFPGYPVSGTYEFVGDMVRFDVETGKQIPPMYVLSIEGNRYLLSAAERGNARVTGEVDECALTAKETATE